MTVTIDIYGPNSMIKGDFPLTDVRLATSYPVEGAHFSKAYKKGVWDGRKHLMSKRTGSFPTGLLDVVIQTCEEHNIDPIITDHRTDPGHMGLYPGSLEVEGVTLRPYQQETCEAALEHKQGIFKIATNGGKTEIAVALTNYLQLPTLFVVTSRELLHQAQARFLKRLPNVTEAEIGIIGDGKWAPGSWVTIATVDTLESRIDRPETRELLENIDVLFLDECHHVGSETWYSVSVFCAAYYRFGMSGTPLDRTDGANLRLIAATGPIIAEVTNKHLVELGVSAKAKIIFDKVTQPVLKPRIQYKTAYKQGVVENEVVLDKIVQWTKIAASKNLSTLILIDEIAHGHTIDDALWNNTDGQFISHQFIHGSETSEQRASAIESFGDRSLPVLIASTILDEGVDVPTIDVLICAGSRKSKIRTMQRLGRGLRGDKLIVIEFANFTNKYLLEHSLKRLEDYKAEECFKIVRSGPDADLLQQLWDED